MSARGVLVFARSTVPKSRCFATAASAKKTTAAAAPSAKPAETPSKVTSSLRDLLEERSSRSEHKDVLIAPVQSVRWTHRELKKHTDAIADGLHDARFQPGAKLAIALRNEVENFATQIGAIKAGLAVVPIDPSSPLRDALAAANSAGAQGIVFHPRVYSFENFQAALPELVGWPIGTPFSSKSFPSLRTLIHTDTVRQPGMLAFRDVQVYNRLPSNLPNIKLDASTLAYQPASGSKGFTHGDVAAKAAAASKTLGLGAEDRVAILAPFHLPGTQAVAWAAVSSASTLLLPAQVLNADAQQTYKNMADERVNLIIATGAVVRELAATAAKHKSTVDRLVFVEGGDADAVAAARSFGVQKVFSYDIATDKLSPL